MYIIVINWTPECISRSNTLLSVEFNYDLNKNLYLYFLNLPHSFSIFYTKIKIDVVFKNTYFRIL